MSLHILSSPTCVAVVSPTSRSPFPPVGTPGYIGLKVVRIARSQDDGLMLNVNKPNSGVGPRTSNRTAETC